MEIRNNALIARPTDPDFKEAVILINGIHPAAVVNTTTTFLRCGEELKDQKEAPIALKFVKLVGKVTRAVKSIQVRPGGILDLDGYRYDYSQIDTITIHLKQYFTMDVLRKETGDHWEFVPRELPL